MMKKVLGAIQIITCIILLLVISNKNIVNASSNIYKKEHNLSLISKTAFLYEKSSSEIPYTSSIVITPNGSNVSVKKYMIDYSKNDIEYRINILYPYYYPNATLISPPTTRYNCHSFAWYSQNSETNVYWMPYPTEYYNDYSYYEVTFPRAGDIICYFDDMNTKNDTSDDENLHSGIIESVNNSQANNICGTSSLVNVISKWGAEGLFLHSGDYCPYTSAFQGDADYVKYYRPRTNYTYTLTNSIDKNISSYLSGNGSITDKYAMYELNANNGLYKFSVSSDKQLDVRLYDEHMQLINLDLKNNGNTNSFIKYLNSGRYYFRVAYQDTNNSGTISINIKHSHNYVAPYVWKNYTQHTATCECGDIHLEPHAVSADSFNHGQRYAPCLLCGGSASIGFIGPMSHNNLPTSPNGSYILPNGVIVLVDDDVELYINGKLTFINLHNNI